MERALYDHPAVYDALYAGKPYVEEVAFVLKRVPAADRALVVGCGTGEHARRLDETGVEAVGVDSSAAMVQWAQRKSDAEFLVGTLPALPIDGRFDLVLAPFTVINYLLPEELAPALSALADRVAEGGLLVLDTGEFPEMDAPALQTAAGPAGDCARLFQFRHLEDRRVRMEALVFHGSSWFVDRHTLTAFDDETVALSLAELGFVVKRLDWDADETAMADTSVFVARRA